MIVPSKKFSHTITVFMLAGSSSIKNTKHVGSIMHNHACIHFSNLWKVFPEQVYIKNDFGWLRHYSRINKTLYLPSVVSHSDLWWAFSYFGFVFWQCQLRWIDEWTCMSKGYYGKSKTEAISIGRPTQTRYDKGKVGRGTLLFVVGVQRGVVSR